MVMLPALQKNTKGYHLLFWLTVAAAWFYLRYQDYASLPTAGLVTVIKVTDLSLIIYFVNLVLVPKFLYKKRYALFVFYFVLTVAVSSFFKMLLLAQVLHQSLSGISIKQAVYNNFVTQFFLVLASLAVKSAVDYIQLQKRMADVAKEKAEAELAFLKAQINPHFLFNSLNAVYFLIDKQNIQARDTLHKFSEMLRYQLYECNGNRLPIEKEVRFLRDYVDLQQLRLNKNTSVEFSCEKDVGRFSIEPLLLMPFVENSFKHLSHFSDGRQNEIQIKMARQNGSMLFSVYNTTEQKGANRTEGGIGMANVQKRLELLYPGKHQLKIKQEDGWFGIELNLSIQS